jgi:hypothetical protein
VSEAEHARAHGEWLRRVDAADWVKKMTQRPEQGNAAA